MKWAVLTALLLVTGGAWLLIYNALDTATGLSAALGGRAETEGTPWRADHRAVRVERGEALVAVRCAAAAPCRGSAALTSLGSGRHLGATAYDIPAGGDARLRFRLPDVARGTTYARLRLGETSEEITLRRR
jgi:hypothetical protein